VLKGVMHVHSRFSDGEEPLESLVKIFKQQGMAFVAVSDHAEVFDDNRMAEYVRLCETLSSSALTVIPGLEFALLGGSIHLLGYGITRRIRGRDIETLVDGIHEAGGIAVLAHPPSGCANIIGAVKTKLDGIEVWNGRYDGMYTPRADAFQLLRSIRTANAGTHAFAGVDLHKRNQADRPLYLEVEAGEVNRESVMTALKSGRFTLRGASLRIPSSGDLTFIQELSIAVKQPLCRRSAG